jgi:ABC-type glycerol-3-phosphate transport system substrate-binding protein
VPLTRYKSAWVYNKDAWKKAGLTDADEPKTWKQWFAAMDKLKQAGLIPIARAGDVQTTSHTCWILMISLDRKQWDGITGGNQFMSLQQKLDSVCGGKWPYDAPWARSGWPALKKLFTYYPPGFSTLKIGDIRQLFYEGKAAMVYESQAFLQLLDETRQEGLAKFDVGAFPTPQPDADTFGADVATNAGRIADDGERGITYSIPIPDLREKGKDAMGQAIAVDFMQWMTQPSIQAEYVKPSYNLPANPNVKLDDPRFAIFQQNPEQIFYRHLMYFNNVSQADRPQWGQNFQAYLSDQVSLDDYLKKGGQQLIEQAQLAAREAKIDIRCG